MYVPVVVHIMPVTSLPCDGIWYQVDRLSRVLKRVRREEGRWRLLAEERQVAIDQLSLACEQSEKVRMFVARPLGL